MGKVTADMNMSLDGFIAGPGARPGNPLGDGIRLFDRLGSEDLDLEPTRVIGSPRVTHVRYRVVK